MQITVRNLLDVTTKTALRILGSTSIATNAGTWVDILRDRPFVDDETKSLAETARQRIFTLAEGRNDFVHAVYGAPDVTYPTGITEDFILRPDIEDLPRLPRSVAMRVRNHTLRSTGDLVTVRNEAAFISVLVAHVEWMTHDHEIWGNEPSPWRDIVALPHPPKPSKSTPRKPDKRLTSPQSPPE